MAIEFDPEAARSDWRNLVASQLRTLHTNMADGHERMNRIEANQTETKSDVAKVVTQIEANTTICNTIATNTKELVDLQRNIGVGKSFIYLMGKFAIWVAAVGAACVFIFNKITGH